MPIPRPGMPFPDDPGLSLPLSDPCAGRFLRGPSLPAPTPSRNSALYITSQLSPGHSPPAASQCLSSWSLMSPTCPSVSRLHCPIQRPGSWWLFKCTFILIRELNRTYSSPLGGTRLISRLRLVATRLHTDRTFSPSQLCAKNQPESRWQHL